ncbi:hypothetical protein FE257_005946 [Aspergillus nanangensis]|uniref:Peptidase S33 tripeptidyl aminopeptidase-like C-terminal domain-containing protein n=1 Tax=Aspergillus nanangensis TaxID=2582783 RepID=A0AAD4CQ17_ASPNN|nr:hypothetical protein FE257_005946 [Aspergillus nanangensis]
MLWKTTLLQFAALSSVHANTIATSNHARSDQLRWGACDVDDPSLQCANLTVPMDYTDPDSDATIQLHLLKVPAVRTPKKGSILFNFGGPGLEARHSLAGLSKRILALTGGDYDLIAHDPRGVAKTFTASCFNTSEERMAGPYAAMSSVADPEDRLALSTLWGASLALGNACYDYPSFQDKGPNLGTVFTARDLMQIVDAVEGDGLLRYWGLSYGTALGATVAAMFPDRIDRMILDSVVNPHQFYNYYDTEIWADADMVFSSFIKECLKAPEHCGFSHRNSTAFDIEKDIYNMIDSLKTEALAAGDQVVDSAIVRSFIRFSLYSPSSYSYLSRALDLLLSNNAAGFMEIYNENLAEGFLATVAQDESAFAIPCSDKIAPQQTFTELGEIFTELNGESRLLGSSGSGLAMICANWRFQAKERYTGNFESKTKHPLLVIGNRYDSATALRCAQNVTASFEDSVLVEHGGFGHGSWSQGSACTSKIIRSYFAEGTLPEYGTICEPDYGPFEPKTIDDVLKDIGFMDGE